MASTHAGAEKTTAKAISGKEERKPAPGRERGRNEAPEVREKSLDPVTLYMEEASRAPLLTAEEEKELKKRMDAGKEAGEKLAALEAEGKGHWKRAETYRAKVADGKEARDTLITSNLRLVISIATKFKGCGMPLLDLVQEGNIGLMTAADRFDASYGTRFSTYATPWISQKISRALQNERRNIRLPVYIEVEMGRYRKLDRQYLREYGRSPTVKEVAGELGITEANAAMLLAYADDTISLNTKVGECDEGEELGNIIADTRNMSVEDQAVASAASEAIDKAMESLTEREREVITLRFGLHDMGVHTLEEIGGMYGVTRERVRQIEGTALRKLKSPSRSRCLSGLI